MGKKWALIIWLSLPVWLVCGVAIGVNYCDHHKHHTYSNKSAAYYDEADLAIKKGDLAVQVVIAGATLFLLVVAVYSLRAANKTSSEAIEASYKALGETKRSVNVAINQERPCILVQKLHFFYRPSEPNIVYAAFEIKNCGRTVGVITRKGYQSVVSSYKVRDVVNLNWDEDFIEEYSVILPGESRHDTLIVFSATEEVERFNSIEKIGRQAVMQAAVIYRDSAGNTYRHRFTAFAESKTRTSGNGSEIFDATIDMSKGHWDDGPWEQPSEPDPYYSDRAD